VKQVIVTGSFDDFRPPHVRFLQEAGRLGPVHVLLWSDEVVEAQEGRRPKFPQAERQYFLEAIRYVDRVTLCRGPVEQDELPPQNGPQPTAWAVSAADANTAKLAYCLSHGLEYRVITEDEIQGFPEPRSEPETGPARKRVVVTGCYDWFHSGHVRFFEEVSALGDLYVVVGHDANIRLLKGEGHPMFCEQERQYMVQSIRFVKQALISTGDGWLDAEPEIERLKPHIYAVNEDGSKPEKLAYCEAHGIEYRVLKRTPKEGLPRRQSTDLRGF
jgi:cytidyltransferase-like protein